MNKAIFVALGAAVGGLCRHFISEVVAGRTTADFPWGTLLVNLAGCLAIGIAWGLCEKNQWAPVYRALVFTGFLGGFTTFSSFGLDSMRLFSGARIGTPVVYIAASNLGGLLLAWIGIVISGSIA